MYFTYILKSEKNGRYYYGSTSNLDQRLREHNNGKNISTRNKGPWKLIYFERFRTLSDARGRELYFKKLKNKNYIDWLISQNG
jgi:putative endonuclease